MNATLERTTILGTTQDVIREVLDAIEWNEPISTSVESIHGIGDGYTSGFIPFTDGGWAGIATFELHSEVSDQVDIIRPFVESDYDDMEDEFRRLHSLSGEVDIRDHPEWEDWASEWMFGGDGTYWFVYCRAIVYLADNHRNRSGEDEVLFCLGINDDFNYGRDDVGPWAGPVGTHWLWEREVPASQLTPETLEQVKAQMIRAWKDA